MKSAEIIRLHAPRIGEFPDVIADLLPHDISLMEKWFTGYPYSLTARKDSSKPGQVQNNHEEAIINFDYVSG